MLGGRTSVSERNGARARGDATVSGAPYRVEDAFFPVRAVLGVRALLEDSQGPGEEERNGQHDDPDGVPPGIWRNVRRSWCRGP